MPPAFTIAALIWFCSEPAPIFWPVVYDVPAAELLLEEAVELVVEPGLVLDPELEALELDVPLPEATPGAPPLELQPAMRTVPVATAARAAARVEARWVCVSIGVPLVMVCRYDARQRRQVP